MRLRDLKEREPKRGGREGEGERENSLTQLHLEMTTTISTLLATFESEPGNLLRIVVV